MQVPVSLLLVCLLPTFGQAAADCSAADAKIAKLTSEVESLRKQLAAAKGGQCSAAEISVTGAVAKTGSMAGDVIQHLLQKTDVDEQIVSVVSSKAEVARAFSSKVVGQITAHPCGSSYDACSKHITESETYRTHVAPHVKTLTTVAQPHVESAKVYINPALEEVSKAYGTATKHVEVVVPTVKQSAALAFSTFSLSASSVFSSIPGHLHKVLDPVFAAFSKASPQHGHVLPQDPVDRLLLIVVLLFVGYNMFFVVRLLLKVATRLTGVVTFLGLRVPLRVAGFIISYCFWIVTGFYVCGLCRKRKNDSKKSDPSKADAKAEPKKSKPCSTDELVSMLKKTQEKGKLNDGVTRLVTAAQSGKPLTGPEEVKGKHVTKDALKKALGKFKEVDIKKLGL
jgi:hypothetical protein